MENAATQPIKSENAFTGYIRLIKHDLGGLSGKVKPEDLIERGPDGRIRLSPEYANRVVEDFEVHNKVLKRGLGIFMHKLLQIKGGTYAPAEINTPTNNPWGAFILVADHTVQGKVGDARVEWDESDGPSNTIIPSDIATARQGRRGVLISDTTNAYLKRVSISYPTTSPYREIEYALYASGRSLVRAVTGGPNDTITSGTGTIYCEFGAFVSGDIGKIFKISGSTNSPSNNGDYTIATVPDGTHITVTEALPGGNEAGHSFMLSSVPDGVYGAAVEAGDAHYLDWFPIKAVGLAKGVACGTGEADSYWGSRAVVGMGPTLQGICDRVYWHEGSALHQYTTGESLWEYDGGFVESGHVGSYDGTKCFDGDIYSEGVTGEVNQGSKWTSIASAGPHKVGRIFGKRWRTITGTTSDTMNTSGAIHLVNGAFVNAAHPAGDVGRVLKVRGAADPLNNKNYTIVSVGGSQDVVVTPVPNSNIPAGTVFMNPSPPVYDGVYSPPKQFKGCRIAMPRGTQQQNAPNLFKMQYLDTNANNGDPNPYNDAHWLDFSGGQFNYLGNAQGTTIYNAGIYGVEYNLSTAVSTYGVRITECTAYDNTKSVEVAEFYLYELMTAVGFTYGTDKLILRVKNTVPFKTFYLPTVSPTQSCTTLATYIDAVVRGWQMEATRSFLGFLWLRGSVGGNNSNLYLDSVANGSSANTKLGFNTAGDSKTGITKPVIKKPTETLTLIYRLGMSGDLTTV